jgi:hypothetical protein
MPSRHISPRSFDEILSELGDDPAIPDPHGIRKTERPKTTSEDSQKLPKRHFNIESLKDSSSFIQVQKLGPFLGFGALLLGGFILLFLAYESMNSNSQAQAEESRKQISELRKEFGLLRNEIQNDQDELYESIESIEVSVHSLKENRSSQRVIAKPQPLSYEAELRRWRYLGTAQMGLTQQAFFQTGKNNSAFEKDALTLGDWRLTQITNESVTFSHPQGKTITLKPFKAE